MMKIYVFLILSFGALAECSLLEMSQVLWSRLLAGGITKGGQLDPLRVPVIKVDQSEGNTSYRIVLRNVEISGLNLSTLESVHIARGRLESNLSELEAGYVSYSDSSELDSIRYRFHTLVKELKPKDGTESSARFTEQSNPSENQAINGRNREYETTRSRVDDRNPFQTRSDNLNSETRDEVVDIVYPETYKPFEKLISNDPRQQEFSSANDERRENVGGIKCVGSCIGHRGPAMSFSAGTSRNGNTNGFRGNRKYGEFSDQEDASSLDDAHVSASESFGQRQAFVGFGQPPEKIVSSPDSRDYRKYVTPRIDNSRQREPAVRSQAYQRLDAAGKANNSNFLLDFHRPGVYRLKNDSKINYRRLPPGYVDIIYADNDDKTLKHFAGFRSEDDQNLRVYGIGEIMEDLEQRNRYMIHNFTETEAIQKRNNLTHAAAESKRIQDLIRYADKFQETQGYFEEGMQLIYHFGGMDDSSNNHTDEGPESNEAKRRKREHSPNDTDEELMYVIVRIRVPVLQLKADYVLTGKVGRQILRGNGLLTGNFTDLIGDFTLELKKVDDNNMIVRAARARLVADQRKVTFQGMNEKGPVQSVLEHGLMAAEAVAAMIADDLATKALSENPTTDSMIYKMYSNAKGSPQ